MAQRTRERVRELLEEGKGVKEIARRLALSPATVSYHKGRLGYKTDRRCALRYDWAAIQAYYDEGYTREQCRERFGFSRAAWTDAVFRGDIKPRPVAMPLERLLAANQPRNRNHVKLRLWAAGLRGKQCEECGIDHWRGRPLSMSLHHVNGDRHDNRIENLTLLCPNCHSQTPNFGVKNWRANGAAA
jgi:hypothetical protein